MGKGDKKTKRGKIWIGSYGVRRPRNKKKGMITATAGELRKRTPKKAEKPAKEVSVKAEVIEQIIETPKKEVIEPVIEAIEPQQTELFGKVVENAEEPPKSETKPKKEKKAAEPKKKEAGKVKEESKKKETPKKKEEVEKTVKAPKKKETDDKPKEKKTTKKAK
jgi:30S ribosomal protein S31